MGTRGRERESLAWDDRNGDSFALRERRASFGLPFRIHERRGLMPGRAKGQTQQNRFDVIIVRQKPVILCVLLSTLTTVLRDQNPSEPFQAAFTLSRSYSLQKQAFI